MSRATRGSARQAARRQAAEAAAPEPAAAPAPPVSLGEPVTSGIDLTGTWKLDMTRSEPLDPYLRAMGLADMAVASIRAAFSGSALLRAPCAASQSGPWPHNHLCERNRRIDGVEGRRDAESAPR